MSVNLGRVAFVAKGAYDAAATYQQYDYVTANNGSYVYISTASTAGIPVTDEAYWQPLLNPESVNAAAEAANTAAQTAAEKAQEANAAAEISKTAAAEADKARLSIADELAKKAPAIYADASGEMVHITDGAEGMPVASLITHIEPKQEGSGDPSPDNVRPISGWDSGGVTRTGKNLLPYLDLSNERNGITFTGNNDGTYTVDGTATADAFYRSNTTPITLGVLPAGQYTMSLTPVTAGYQVRGRVTNKTSNANAGTTNNSTGVYTFTADGVSEYGFGFYVPSGKTVEQLTVSFQIEPGTTATEHEQHQSQTLTAELPETVYGGVWDWTTGLVTVTHAKKVFDGTEPWGVYNGGLYVVGGLPGFTDEQYSQKPVTMCSHYLYGDIAGGSYIFTTTAGGLSPRFVNIGKTLEEWKEWVTEQYVAGTPVSFVYPLAEPYTIQLTPQQMETLKGTNNIWSNAGGTAVTYAADTKMYIDQKIAAIAAAIVNG